MTHHLELASRFSRHLDQERHWNRDPEVVNNCFIFVKKTIVKYYIPTENIFNIDKKKFLMGVAEAKKLAITNCKLVSATKKKKIEKRPNKNNPGRAK